jgi:hypothetical protein
VIVGLAVAVVLLGCASVGVTGFVVVHKAKARTESVVAVNPAATFPAHEQDLSHYVIAPPGDSTPWRSKPTDEPLDLAGAAADTYSNQDLGEGYLTRYHFRRGFARHWIDAIGSIDEVRLLQFDSPASARDYFTFYVTANTASGNWGDPIDVPAVDGAENFVKPLPDKNGFQQALSVAGAGDIVVMVLALQPAPADARVSDDILTAEYPHLQY